jgi:hypothetical protein
MGSTVYGTVYESHIPIMIVKNNYNRDEGGLLFNKALIFAFVSTEAKNHFKQYKHA